MTRNNPDLDLVNINAHPKFGQIPPIRFVSFRFKAIIGRSNTQVESTIGKVKILTHSMTLKEKATTRGDQKIRRKVLPFLNTYAVDQL